MLNRNVFIQRLNEVAVWDIIVIGGGATGLGIALDAASRGFSTLLLEQSDFAKGTSSRSTKLVHGGVRYLAQGNFRLVYQALHERGLLMKNAPHLVKPQSFIIPCYNWADKVTYLLGLKLYDSLSGRLSLGSSRFLDRQTVMSRLPSINEKSLIGGVEYYDAQFDDARLAINLAQTSCEKGAILLNYFKVTGLIKKNDKLSGILATDLETNKEYQLHAKVIINATGVFVDAIRGMDSPLAKPLVRPSQGVHLVFDSSFLGSRNGVMIPKTADGRVLFAIPWHGHVLVGTTDTPLNQTDLEPLPLEKEIDFILQTVRKCFSTAPNEKDILSVFAGLRPLAATVTDRGHTKEISRDHKLLVSESGLITITGGKWTTYRRMAEHAVNTAITITNLPHAPCDTKKLKIHGCRDSPFKDHLSIYGTDADGIRQLIKDNPSIGKKLIERFPNTEAEVVWSIRHEMARTVEDVLARRLRILFLDARAAIEVAPIVAGILQRELDRDEKWAKEQVEEFRSLAHYYTIMAYNLQPAIANN